MTVHADSFAALLVLGRKRIEQSMSMIAVTNLNRERESAFAAMNLSVEAHWTVMALDIGPEIVIRKLKSLRKKSKQSPIDGVC